MRLRRIVLAALIAIPTAAFGFACSLDLDEALINRRADGGGGMLGDANLPDGTVITESGVPILPDGGSCTKNEDCVSANACLAPRCDLTRRTCAYDVCHTAACTAGTCDQAAKTCSAPTTYKLKAGELTLDQPTTGGIIVAYPWLFQMTSTGVLVYDVSNPTKTKPTQVPLVGVGFLPNQFTRSGNRIWIGAPLAGTPARLPVSYIDIPADPFATKIEARTVLANYSRPATETVGFVASENKGAFVIGPTPTFPTALLDTLLAEPATKTATPLGLKPDTIPISVSGSRIVVQGLVPEVLTPTNAFGLVAGAGTTNPVADEPVAITDLVDPSVSRGTTQTLDGTVFLATGVHAANPAIPAGVQTRAVRAYVLVKDGAAKVDAASKGADIEVYPANEASPPLNADILRAPTMIDNDTWALAVAALENTGTATAIHFVKRDLTTQKDKRITLSHPIGTIAGSSASNGIAYFAVNVPSGVEGAPPTGKVFVLDPSCAP